MCVCGIHDYLAILKRKQEATKNFAASNLTAFIDFFSSPEPKAHKGVFNRLANQSEI